MCVLSARGKGNTRELYCARFARGLCLRRNTLVGFVVKPAEEECCGRHRTALATVQIEVVRISMEQVNAR